MSVQNLLETVAQSPQDIKTPYDILKVRCPRLVGEVLDHEHHGNIGQFLYVVFNTITIEAIQKKSSIGRIKARAAVVDEGRHLKIWIEYGRGGEGNDLTLLWLRNQQIARMLEVNDNVVQLATTVVELLQKWATDKKVLLSEVVVHRPMIPRGESCILADLLTSEQLSEKATDDVLMKGVLNV